MSQEADLRAIVAAIERALPKGSKPVPLHEPHLDGTEWNYVKACLDSGWVSSSGPFVEQFEKRLSEFTGIPYAVAVVNGTAALHLALKLVGVMENDEVLVPALTFVATANAVRYCGAVPHFVDCEERTLGLDPVKLDHYLSEIGEVRNGVCLNKQTGRRIKAVVPMHAFGHPVDLDPLIETCGRYQLELVEDAAESLGSYYKGIHTGSFGKAAAVSFNGNKIVTTGGGGAIFTKDKKMAKRARHLATTAKLPHPWAYIHDEIGYNYRMPNLNAALGMAQLQKLPHFIKSKRHLAQRYQSAFQTVKGVRFFTEPDFSRSNYWLNVILLDEAVAHSRDALIQLAHQKGILVRPAWALMHRLSMYRDCPRMDLTVAQSLERRLVALPSSPALAGGLEDA